MHTVHYVIHSYGLIPEVELFVDSDSAKKYWIGAFGDLPHDYDGKTPEESFEIGFAHWHETELRLGSHTYHSKTNHTITPFTVFQWLQVEEMVATISNDQQLGKEIRDFYRRLTK